MPCNASLALASASTASRWTYSAGGCTMPCNASAVLASASTASRWTYSAGGCAMPCNASAVLASAAQLAAGRTLPADARCPATPARSWPPPAGCRCPTLGGLRVGPDPSRRPVRQRSPARCRPAARGQRYSYFLESTCASRTSSRSIAGCDLYLSIFEGGALQFRCSCRQTPRGAALLEQFLSRQPRVRPGKRGDLTGASESLIATNSWRVGAVGMLLLNRSAPWAGRRRGALGRPVQASGPTAMLRGLGLRSGGSRRWILSRLNAAAAKCNSASERPGRGGSAGGIFCRLPVRPWAWSRCGSCCCTLPGRPARAPSARTARHPSPGS